MNAVTLYCFCGDSQDQHGQNGMIPCGCGCPRFMLDTIDPNHTR